MTKPVALTTELHETETRLLNELRALRRRSRTRQGSLKLTVGQRIADTVAANMGSWRVHHRTIDHFDNLDNPQRYGLRVSMGSLSVHPT